MELYSSVFKDIWLVDDDEDDQLVFEEALRDVLPHVQPRLISSGDELVELLDYAVPDILFLDINMPGTDGMDCLKQIRDKRGCGRLPVIMYSVSRYHLDITACYGYGATLYLIKPSSQSRLAEQLELLFRLNWNEPEQITENHFVDNRFVPFSAG